MCGLRRSTPRQLGPPSPAACALLAAVIVPFACSQTSAPTAELTLADLRNRCAAVPRERRTPDDAALLAATDFTLALLAGDSRTIIDSVEVIGYQPLPSDDRLAPYPQKPIAAHAIAARFAHVQTVGGVPRAVGVTVLTRDQVRERHPAAARWMLPDDRAVVIPKPTAMASGWIVQDAFLVVRMRGRRAAIVGGNLLEALEVG